MDTRMNGVMNGIVSGDGEYQAILRESDIYSGELDRMDLSKEIRLLIDRYVSEQNALGSRYGMLAYLLGFSDCKAMFLGKCLPTEVKEMITEYYPPWEPPVSRFRAIRKWYFPPSEPPQHIVAAHIFDFTINLLIVILGELLMQYHQIIYGEVFLCLRRQKSEVFWNFWEKI